MEILDAVVNNPRPRAGRALLPNSLTRTTRLTDLHMPAHTNKVFRLERDQDVLVVVPQGDANGFRYHDVHQESNATLLLLDDPTLQHAVIDLGCEQILGSIIISVVIKICRKIGQKGGKAAFCNASPDMQEVLATMNLTRLWNYHATRTEAVLAVRAA